VYEPSDPRTVQNTISIRGHLLSKYSLHSSILMFKLKKTREKEGDQPILQI
jgi:hypothetical protein